MKKSESIAVEIVYNRTGIYVFAAISLALLVSALLINEALLALASIVSAIVYLLFADSIKILKRRLSWWQRLENGGENLPLRIVEKYQDLLGQQELLRFDEESAQKRGDYIARLEKELEAPLKE